MPEPTDAEFLRNLTATRPHPMLMGLRIRAIARRLDKLDAAFAAGQSSCGNARHPDGAWHPAEPLPFYSLWNWRARLAFWWRTKRWGCGCLRRTHA